MIHLILGQQGSGKTLFLVMKAWEHFNQNKKIYSNVKLNFPFEQLDYKDVIECNLADGVVILDEIHLLLPARASMRKINREICDGFLSMVRKKNLEVFGTTQTMRKVDVRFREEADYIYSATRYAFNKGEWFEVMHNQNLSKDVPIMIKLVIQETFSNNVVEISFIGNKYFDLYDTSQIIKVKGI